MSEIRKDQIAEKDVLANLIPTKSQLDTVNALNLALKELAKTAQEGLKADGSSVAGMKKQGEAQERLKVISQEKAKLDKQKIVLSEKLRNSESAEAKEVAKLREEINRKNKTVRDEIKADLDKGNAYKTLVRETRELKNQSKTLGAELLVLGKRTKDNATQWDRLEKEYKDVTAAAQRGDVQLKKLDKTVGDNFRNVGNYEKAVGGLKSALGQLGLAVGVGAVVRNVGQTIVEFDSAIADLSAITGAAGKDLDFFKENAISLGVNVKGGASAVVEAYKLIASAKPELLENAAALNQVTEASILLAKASGMELPDAATALTDAMNQFGVGADQASKFVDVLASGAKFGSAEIPQITQALLKFGAVAKTSNVNIQESTALIENLAENGLKGAEAGTALRNVMLKLSAPDALPKEARDMMQALGINFDDLTDKSKPFNERLDALKPLLTDNAALIKVFGTENAVAATTLLSTTDRIAELTEQVDANGVALEQANTRSKTVSEAFNKLKETFNGIILSFANGAEAGSRFAGALDFLANNLGTIVSTLAKLVVGYAAYRTTLIAVNIVQAIQEKGLKGIAKEFFNVSKGADVAEKSNSKLGRTLKGIGWAAIAALVVEVGMAMWDIASGAARARYETDLLAKANARFGGASTKLVDDTNKALESQIKLIQQRRELGEITAAEEKRQTEAAIQGAKNLFTDRKNLITQEADQLEAVIKRAREAVGDGRLAGSAQMGSDILNALGIDAGGDAVNALSKMQAKLTALRETERLLGDETSKLGDRTSDLNHEFKVLSQDEGGGGGSIKKTDDSLKELNETIIDQRDYLKEALDFWEEYRRQTDILNIDEDAIFQSDLDREAPTLEIKPIITDEDEDKLFDQINQLQQGITAALEAQIDRRIDLYRKEEEAAKSQQDYFKELAAQGNINAQQSLAKQVEIERDAIREQQRLEKQKQNLQVISSGLQTFNSALSSGKTPGQAFAETILTTQALVQFLSNLSFFEKGTDNAPAGHAIVDEKGAEIITDRMGKIKQIGTDGGARLTKLAAGDKVKTAEETANIMAQLGAMGNFTTMKPKDNAGNSYDLLALGRLEAIERAIKNQPHSTTDWNRIGNGMGEIIERKVKGKDIFINRHRIK
jgi:TP901 family phage tail tape measure protein